MSFQPPPATYPEAPPAPPQRERSLGSALLILGLVAVVCAAAGALGMNVALGPVHTVHAAPAAAKPSIPVSFQSLPPICPLLPDTTVQQLAPHAAAKPGDIHITGNGDHPSGGCIWQESDSSLPQQRILSIEVVLYQPSALGTGPDLAKAALDKKAADDGGKAGKTAKGVIGTHTYGAMTQISGLGEQSYSFYDLNKLDPAEQGTGMAFVWVRRGNVIVEVDYTGFDSQSGIHEIPEATARSGAEEAARTIVGELNSCTGCSAH